jgi:hypothetical protein
MVFNEIFTTKMFDSLKIFKKLVTVNFKLQNH